MYKKKECCDFAHNTLFSSKQTPQRSTSRAPPYRPCCSSALHFVFRGMTNMRYLF